MATNFRQCAAQIDRNFRCELALGHNGSHEYLDGENGVRISWRPLPCTCMPDPACPRHGGETRNEL